MGIDVIYTNGVIAAQEKYLLKDRIFKLCEGSAPQRLSEPFPKAASEAARRRNPHTISKNSSRRRNGRWTILSANTLRRGRRPFICSLRAIFITPKRS